MNDFKNNCVALHHMDILQLILIHYALWSIQGYFQFTLWRMSTGLNLSLIHNISLVREYDSAQYLEPLF